MLPPVYPILDVDTVRKRSLSEESLLARWLGLGLRVVQIRWKSSGLDEYVAYAQRWKALFPDLSFIANDHFRAVTMRPDIFRCVHLGQEDWAALPEIPDGIPFGISTHNARQLEVALSTARRIPIAYAALGPVRPTRSKPSGTDPVLASDEFETCLRLVTGTNLDLVLIGGIDAANIETIIPPGFKQKYGYVPVPALISAATGPDLDAILARVQAERN